MIIPITTTITIRMHEQAKQYGIKWNEALRVGIGVLLAEKGVDEYCGELNVYRKIERLSAKLEESVENMDKLSKELAIKEMMKNAKS